MPRLPTPRPQCLAPATIPLPAPTSPPPKRTPQVFPAADRLQTKVRGMRGGWRRPPKRVGRWRRKGGQCGGVSRMTPQDPTLQSPPPPPHPQPTQTANHGCLPPCTHSQAKWRRSTRGGGWGVQSAAAWTSLHSAHLQRLPGGAGYGTFVWVPGGPRHVTRKATLCLCLLLGVHASLGCPGRARRGL